MQFIIEVDKVKNIFRQTYLADGNRKENDAEHSWHLALMAVLLKEYSKDRVVFTLSRPLPEDFPFLVEKLQDGFYCLNYDNPEALRTLLDELHKRGLEPEGLEIGKANLEEVFMRITSK